ncbi:hypothetical protein BRADO6415 [Bradyrhizobium sp. ORS 278]|uniref:hypothetical protein n=1 Tax=Bradyrhizobium sp. (strain ORS 278) TaxID=114615 RepID=UPI00015085F8|nr:hypothetical protein [Bradyrhizobium sp. ORS 278]CAL80040.1 hypothetical protein BRADO6415 [Bradyrhizobium sp. ORS 278]
MCRPMDLKNLQTAYDDFNKRDAELVARQELATTDRERYLLERLRRGLLVHLEATVQEESDRDFIGQIERQIAGQQRAA